MSDLLFGRRQFLIIDMDPSEFEALQRLADHVPYTLQADLVQKTASLLLCSVLTMDRNDVIDGFSRLIIQLGIVDSKKSSICWGEFIQLLNYFREMRRTDFGLAAELKRLPQGELRVLPEERFEVELAKRGCYLLVS